MSKGKEREKKTQKGKQVTASTDMNYTRIQSRGIFSNSQMRKTSEKRERKTQILKNSWR